jgi:ATP-dependent Zn protease
LGGLVAEEVIFGDRSVAAGGEQHSGLGRVTQLAVAMVREFGFGKSLFHVSGVIDYDDPKSFAADPHLKRDVHEILLQQFEACVSILTANKPVLLAMALALLKVKLVSGERLASFLERVSVTACQGT